MAPFLFLCLVFLGGLFGGGGGGVLYLIMLPNIIILSIYILAHKSDFEYQKKI